MISKIIVHPVRVLQALMSQEFIKSDGETVEEVRKKLVADIGENVTVRRFVRYDMGAGLEKKQDDLAAEVEKQTEALKSQARLRLHMIKLSHNSSISC